MCIIRERKKKNFTQISNNVFINQELSWKAKGLLGYLLSRPDNWYINVSDLTNQGPEGKAAILATLKELETHGHLNRKRIFDKQGRFKWEKTVYENPSRNPNFKPVNDGRKPANDKPVSACSVVSNTPIVESEASLPPSAQSCQISVPLQRIVSVATPVYQQATAWPPILSQPLVWQQQIIAQPLIPLQPVRQQQIIAQPLIPLQPVRQQQIIAQPLIPLQPVQQQQEIVPPQPEQKASAQKDKSANEGKPVLSFKRNFSETEKVRMIGILKCVGDVAQQLILLLEMMMTQTVIINPVSYLAALVKKYQNGQINLSALQPKNVSEQKQEPASEQVLSFKGNFDEEDKATIRAMLRGIDKAQQIIWTLEQSMSQKEIKKPIAYLAGIIKKYQNGEFTPLSQEQEKQNVAAEHEAKRVAGVKDCPYCNHYDGFVSFKEQNGHRSARLCNHDEAWILKTAQHLDALITSAKRGYKGPREDLSKPIRTVEEQKIDFFKAMEKLNNQLDERKAKMVGS